MFPRLCNSAEIDQNNSHKTEKMFLSLNNKLDKGCNLMNLYKLLECF